MKSKKIIFIKFIILSVFYLLIFPITLILFKLIPYIIANDNNIDLENFSFNILKHQIKTLVEITQSHYVLPFIITQAIILLVLFLFINQKKRKPFEVVGKTNPVHGSAYWGEQKEINAPKDVHLVSEKKMKEILKETIGETEND